MQRLLKLLSRNLDQFRRPNPFSGMNSKSGDMDMKENRRTGYRYVGFFIMICLACAGAELCFVSVQAQNPSVGAKAQEDPIPVSPATVAPVKPYVVSKASIIRNLLLTGELKAARSISITAPDIRSSFSNMVTFLAPEGKQIKKGERIVEFDDSSLMSQKSEAERNLDETKLTIDKTKADQEAQRCDLLNSLSQAQSQLKQDQLYAKISKDLLPANTYQKYQLNLEKSKLSLDKAKEQLSNFEKNYASQMALVEINKSQAEINLKKIVSDMSLLKIDAPQDGILIYGDNWQSNRKVQTGDNMFHGMEAVSLPDLTSMQVVGYVYDTEYGSLASDMRCDISFDALPGYTVGGKIVTLSSVAGRKGFSSQKKVFQATVQLDRVDAQLMKPGMTAIVKIPMVLAAEATAIPREFMGVDTQGKSFVLKKKDEKNSQKQLVSLGAIGDQLVQITSGVSVGDPLLPVKR
jgi:HlyD family secretion protein